MKLRPNTHHINNYIINDERVYCDITNEFFCLPLDVEAKHFARLNGINLYAITAIEAANKGTEMLQFSI